jgi:hypothetical protein
VKVPPESTPIRQAIRAFSELSRTWRILEHDHAWRNARRPKDVLFARGV